MEHEFNNLRVCEQHIIAAMNAGNADEEAEWRAKASETLARIQSRFDAITVLA